MKSSEWFHIYTKKEDIDKAYKTNFCIQTRFDINYYRIARHEIGAMIVFVENCRTVGWIFRSVQDLYLSLYHDKIKPDYIIYF